MNGKILVFVMICMFFLTNLSALPLKSLEIKTNLQTHETISYEIIPYSYSTKDVTEFEQSEILFYNDVELLWNCPGEGNFVFSTLLNNDGIPDVIANDFALDGSNGEKLLQLDTGDVIAVGDIDNDNIDEIFTKKNCYPTSHDSTLYCYNKYGTLLWSKNLAGSKIFSVSIGDLRDNKNNEVVVGVGYLGTNCVYCINGVNGELLWAKPTQSPVFSTEIVDVDSNGENDVIAGTNMFGENYDKRALLYCLKGTNGDELWTTVKYSYELDWDVCGFRVFCIGDLNSDRYKEIVVEWGYDISCVSGENGDILWTWKQPPNDIGGRGSFQTIQIADMITDYEGDEIIIGGCYVVYCLTSDGKKLWDFGINDGLNKIVTTSAIGDLDKDGLLDVALLTFSSSDTGSVYALNGQNGLMLWEYLNCGNSKYGNKGILCADLTDDGFAEVVAKSNSYVCALLSNCIPQNNQPNIPVQPSGPISGAIGEEYTYTTSTIDPDGDQLWYKWNWDDGTDSDWLGPYDSGTECSMLHTWTSKGSYNVKVKAKDTSDAESKWSDPLSVSMPRNRATNTPVINFLEKHPIPYQLFQRFPFFLNLLIFFLK